MKSFQQVLAIAALSSTTLFTACNNNEEEKTAHMQKGIVQQDWGEADGKPVYLYKLTNSNGMEVTISNYGGTVTSWITPDKQGNRASIVLGFDSLAKYRAGVPYFGALIGRYGNRIAKGMFTLGDSTYKLATNDGPNHLHGGEKGFDKVVWEAKTIADSLPTLVLAYHSKDGEEGYPGTLDVTVQYTLTDDDELKIEYNATTDKMTPINLTNHSYFNLTGSPANTVLGHELMIKADKYTPVDSTLIPTGELKDVAGTPFDFNTPTAIGARIDQIPGDPGGYDHNFVLNKTADSMMLAATVHDPKTGRMLEVYTMEPGIQFYSGNFLDGTLIADDGTPIQKHAGMCLETQHFPDSPNQPAFPSTILSPGEKYHTVTIYKVSVK